MLKSLTRSRTQTSDRHDITQGNLVHNIQYMAWPMLLTQFLFMAPNLYDAVWLGQLGSGAQAAAGLATSIRMTMISLLMALSGGSGAVVARYVGAKDHRNANLAVLQAVLLMAVSAGALGVIGILFVEPLMRLAGADASVLPLAVRYARILFAGLIAMEMVPSVGGMLSSAGAPQLGMWMRVWAMCFLLVAEPLLVRWLGLEGAVLALVGSNVVAMLWGLSVLIWGRAPIHIDVHDLRLDFPMMGRILRIAGPAVIQRGTPNLAQTVLTRLIASYGPETLAAWIVARRIFQFAQTPSLGLARSTPAMVGQNLGAGRPERAERAVTLISRVVLVTTVVVLAALAIWAPQVMSLFSDDPAALPIGVQVLRVLSLGYLAFSLTNVYDFAQAGAGDTVSPMLINVIALWAVQIPLAYLLSMPLGLGADGIWIALVVGWAVQMVLMFRRYRQGRWKLKTI